MKPPAWHTQAACRHVDTSVFFIERGGKVSTEAVRACRTCPVAEQCFEWAIRHEIHGWWAGTSARQRQQIRRANGITQHNPSSQLTDPDNLPDLPTEIDPNSGARTAKCGTGSGYYRHRRLFREPACDACRRAKTAANRRRTQAKQQQKIDNRTGIPA